MVDFIRAYDTPLSADIGIVKDGGKTWLFDVGCGEKSQKELSAISENANVVISHFHKDHIGNIENISFDELFLSKESYKYIHKGTIVETDLRIGNIHIFSLPSTHAKGCLGMEVFDKYVFVGDAIYGKQKEGKLVYNVQKLREEIDVLQALKATLVLESHNMEHPKDKKEVISYLEEIYASRGDGPFVTWEEN